MSKIIKQAVVEPKTVSVGDQVNFIHWIPLQNIGRTTETLSGRVIKVNRVTVTVHCDQDGCVWGVRKDELVDQAEHNTYIHVMMITIEQYIDVYGKFELQYNNKQYKTIKI